MAAPTSSTAALQIRGMLCDPGDHFKGRYEVERKYRVDLLEPVRSKILSMGAVPFTLGNVETDIFLDLSDGRLASNDQQQVLRLMQPSGRVLWICKGPGADRCVAMDLDGSDKALEMLSALGYVETGRLAKNRDIYFAGDFHVTLDHLDGLGSFAEVAVMTDDADSLPLWATRVETFARKLGLDASRIEPRSYRAMMNGSSPD
ncbi:class IV adenylate cyclase [Hoeflea alexandrii]|uniref:class IV adenylate cyclase n=1 Tax=Hoeflea alexandrii TaxID=288436 RepID=UPI0022AEE0CA|nr:class IV adenylate cyclase [Hoeflea alexandrii]MCZ4287934.1 class IV adenylate cyclase [Hoeflea alexandrii]